MTTAALSAQDLDDAFLPPVVFRRIVNQAMLTINGAGLLVAGMICSSFLPSDIDWLPMLAVFAAAAISSVAGFAFSPICGAFLFHLLDAPVEVVRTLVLCSIANQLLAVYMMRGDIDWRRLLPFVAAGAAGVPVGVSLLLHTDTAMYLGGFGLLLVGYSACTLLRRKAEVPVGGPWGDWVSGLCGGIIGGVAAFPGMAVVLWTARRGWSKAEQRAVYQPFILVMQCLTLITLTLMNDGAPAHHMFDAPALAFVPISLLGTWCGVSIFRRLTDRQFGSATHVLLMVSGLALAL